MRESIAIIGSGMAGLAAARLCHDAGHQVTIYEAQQGLGMDAHSLTLHGGLVDVPLRVMSPQAWHSVISLAAQVGVDTFATNAYASCSWLDGRTWFRNARMPVTNWPIVGSWRYLGPSSLRLGAGLWQLRRATHALGPEDAGMTLADFVARHQPDPLFWRGLVLPLLTTICTCSETHLMAWPARELLGLLDNILYGDTLRRLVGGTPALAAALARGLTTISGSPVVSVRDDGDGLQVRNARGEGSRHDRVIVATPTTHLDFLDAEAHARELAALRAIRFDRGVLVVHTDTRFLPARRADWSALNYLIRPDLSEAMFTVCVNEVEPTLRGAPIVLQTWNPLFEPAAEHVIASVPLARAVSHGGSAGAHAALAQLHQEAGRRLFFCGSWAYPGVPLLESAVRSAQHVAALLAPAGQAA